MRACARASESSCVRVCVYAHVRVCACARVRVRAGGRVWPRVTRLSTGTRRVRLLSVFAYVSVTVSEPQLSPSPSLSCHRLRASAVSVSEPQLS
eukprot:580992-Pleurochrysis_carterae.AAC.1